MSFFTAKPQPRYSNLRRKRKLRKISNVSVPQIPGSKNMFLGVLGFISIVIVVFLFLKVLSLDYFQIRSIETLGVRSVASEQVVRDVEGLTNQGIFITSRSAIEKELLLKYPSFKFISVKKIWPDKLLINITEKQPAFFYVNLNGIYLINEDGVISEVIHQEKINFSEQQLGLLTGEEGVNSTLVTERLESEFMMKLEEEKRLLPSGTESEEEELEEFDITQVPQEEKFEMLDKMKTELLDQAELIIRSTVESADLTVYPSLDTIYAFDNQLYEETDLVDDDRLKLTSEMLKFSMQRGLEITEIRWEGRYIVKFKTIEDQVIILGTSRNISEQFEDYIIVTEELEKEGKNYHEIDLSSRKVSVK